MQKYHFRGLRNGRLALRFLDHLAALGLSVARVSEYGSCGRKTPIPPEVSRFSLRVKGNDSRVTPEKLLC